MKNGFRMRGWSSFVKRCELSLSWGLLSWCCDLSMELYIGAVSSEPPTHVHAHAEARTWAETDAEATGLYRAQDDCLSMDVFTSRVTVCVCILLLLYMLEYGCLDLATMQ
jgi:hypothetical protein